MKIFFIGALSFWASNVCAVTECNEKIVNYFIGTSKVNQSEAHLWVSFQGGGSASVGSQSQAFDGMLSTVITSMVSDKKVKMRYLADNVDCKSHHGDWVGLWIYK